MLKKLMEATGLREDPVKVELEGIPLHNLQSYCDNNGLSLRVHYRSVHSFDVEIKKDQKDPKPLIIRQIPFSLAEKVTLSIYEKSRVYPVFGQRYGEKAPAYIFEKIFIEQGFEKARKDRWLAQLRRMITHYLPRSSSMDGYSNRASLQLTKDALERAIQTPDREVVRDINPWIEDRHFQMVGSHPLVLLYRLCGLVNAYPANIRKFEDKTEYVGYNDMEHDFENAWLARRIQEHLIQRIFCTSEQRIHLFEKESLDTSNPLSEEQRIILDEVASDVARDMKDFATRIEEKITAVSNKISYKDEVAKADKEPKGGPYRT